MNQVDMAIASCMAVIALGGAVYAWRERKFPGRGWLAVVLLGGALAALLRLCAPFMRSDDGRLIFNWMERAVLNFLPAAWFMVALSVTGQSREWGRALLLALWALPALTLLGGVLDTARPAGAISLGDIGGVVQTAYAWVIWGAAALMLGDAWSKARGWLRWQIGTLLGVTVITWAGQVGYWRLAAAPVNLLYLGLLCGVGLVLWNLVHERVMAPLDDQQRQAAALVLLARATAENFSLEAMSQRALEALVSLTNAEKGSLLLFNETGQVTHSIPLRGKSPAPLREILFEKVLADGLAGWMLRERKAVLIADATADSRWLTLPEQPYSVGSVLGAPIVLGERILGEVILIHPKKYYFLERDLDLLTTVMPHITLALRNVMVYEKQQRTATQQMTLYEVVRILQRARMPQQVVEQAVRVIQAQTSWPLVALVAHDVGRQQVRMGYAAGPLAPPDDWVLGADVGVFGQAIRTTISQYAPYLAEEAAALPGLEQLASLILAPVMKGKQVEWLLLLGSDMPLAFDTDARLLAESLVEIISLALASTRLYAALQNELVERNRAEERLWATVNKTDTLYRISRSVIGTYQLGEVLQTVVNGIVAALHADRVSLLLFDPQAERVLDCVFGGQTAEQMTPPTYAELLAGIPDGVLRDHTPLLCDARSAEQGLCFLAEVGSKIVAPLYSYQRVFAPIHGVIIACNHQENREFTQQDMDLMMAIAVQAASAIQNARLFNAVVEERGRLQALVQSSRDGVLLVGLDLRILVANSMVLRYMGLDERSEQWVGEPFGKLLFRLRTSAPHLVQTVVQERRRIRRQDYTAGEGDIQVGKLVLHWLNLPVVVDAQQLGRLIVLRDITEERLLERMREDLTHTMVHDLRSPLTGIYGALQLLRRSVEPMLDAPQMQMLDIAQSSTDRMLQLVNAILDIGRLESGRMPIQVGPFSLGDVVEMVVAAEGLRAAQKHVRIAMDVAEEIPPVWADRRLIERVLQNLINNAVKFTPEGGQVQIASQYAAPEGGKVLVTVADTGPGIPPELRNRLFQKFVTGDLEARGSGLGLAFCRMVLETHGERIWVESVIGQGTTFAFTLSQAPARK